MLLISLLPHSDRETLWGGVVPIGYSLVISRSQEGLRGVLPVPCSWKPLCQDSMLDLCKMA